MMKMISFIGFVGTLVLSFSMQASTIRFTDKGVITDSGSNVIDSNPIIISYEKYPKCNAQNRMMVSFFEVWYQVDNGLPKYERRAFGQKLVKIELPLGAKSIAIWFRDYTLQNPSQPPPYICEEYDNNGQPYVNYRFQIQ